MAKHKGTTPTSSTRNDVFVHIDIGSLDRKLDQILSRLQAAEAKEIRMDAKMTASLAKLNTSVEEQTSVEQSIETLLTGLSAQIASLKQGQTDPAVIDAIDKAAALVSSNTAAAKAAVIANTPAAE